MPVVPCPPPTPIVLGIVTFDVSTFLATYPEFTGFATGTAPTQSSAKLSASFALAQTILNNTCCSAVQDANLRDTLLQMLTAHITFLLYGSDDGAGNVTPPPGIIGHIDTATEGTVSVAASFGGDGGPTQDWYTATRYGALYWVATSNFRTFIPIPAPAFGPNGACAGFGPGFGAGGFGGFVGPGCGC